MFALINESVIAGHDEVAGIGASSQTPDEPRYFFNGFFAGNEHFIFRFCFVAAGVDLVMINVYNISAELLPKGVLT